MIGRKRSGNESKKGFLARNWHFLVVLIFGMILSVGVWSMITQVMTGDDYAFHVTRLMSASKGWANGQIIPQVDPDTLNGFGYAYNLFYGPLLSYIAAGLQALINFWPVVINLILILCLVGSGLTMCYTMTKISKNQVLAALVAVFYMSMPYVLNNLYSRMALGEVAAAVAAPILLLGLYQLTIDDKHAARSIALSAAMLILSHSLSAMLFALMAAVYVILNLRKVINWQNIWRMMLGVLVALGLTAFFTLPLLEAKMMDTYGVFDAGYSDVYFGANARSMNDHRIWPQQLLTMDYTYKVNAEGLGGEFGVTLGVVALVGLLGFWFVRSRIEDEDQRRFVTSLYIIAVLAILLALPIVNWNMMPGIMWQMQFPWRSLMIAVICLAVVAGYTVYDLVRGLSDEKQRVAMVVASMLAAYFVMPLTLPRADRHIDLDKVAEDPVLIGWEGEYAPMQLLCSPEKEEDVAQGYACSLSRIRELLDERGDEVRVISGNVMPMQVNRDGLKMTVTLENDGNEESVVELPMIYYPGFQAEMDGKALQVSPSHKYGLVAVTIPAKAEGELKVWYGLSLATQIGGLISASTLGLGLVWMLISGVADKRKLKKQTEMYDLMESVREAVEEDMLEVEFNHEADKAAILASLDAADNTSAETTTVTTEQPAEPAAESKVEVVPTSKRSDTTKSTKTKTTKKKAKKSSTKNTTVRRATTTRVRMVKSDDLESE